MGVFSSCVDQSGARHKTSRKLLSLNSNRNYSILKFFFAAENQRLVFVWSVSHSDWSHSHVSAVDERWRACSDGCLHIFVLQGECLGNIIAYIKDNPRSSPESLRKEVEKEVAIFAARISSIWKPMWLFLVAFIVHCCPFTRLCTFNIDWFIKCVVKRMFFSDSSPKLKDIACAPMCSTTLQSLCRNFALFLRPVMLFPDNLRLWMIDAKPTQH